MKFKLSFFSRNCFYGMSFSLIIIFFHHVAFANMSCKELLEQKKATQEIVDTNPALIKYGERTFYLNPLSRTQAEKKFKQESKAISETAINDPIEVEIIVSPFYYPLWHTALRVGNSLYEFGLSGWKIHPGGENSARAFLFNNPYFKEEYLKYKGQIPWFSVGIPIRVEKFVIQKFIELVNSQAAKDEKFNLYNNSCNHCIVDYLAISGFDLKQGFTSDGFFTNGLSILTARQILQNSPHVSNKELSVYPAVNSENRDSELLTIPEQLQPEYKFVQELKRLAKPWINSILRRN